MRGAVTRMVLLWLSPCLLVTLSPRPLHGQDIVLIDSPMYKAPELPVNREEMICPKSVKQLWLKALARPEADFKCRAAGTFALAHQRGMKDLDEVVAPLRAELDKPEQHAAVRVAVARALVTLDRKAAAESL